jgi:hypothetical protein
MDGIQIVQDWILDGRLWLRKRTLRPHKRLRIFWPDYRVPSSQGLRSKYINGIQRNIVLSADDQILDIRARDILQLATYKLHNANNEHNMIFPIQNKTNALWENEYVGEEFF